MSSDECVTYVSDSPSFWALGFRRVKTAANRPTFYVVATSVGGTEAALRTACRLAGGDSATVLLVVPQPTARGSDTSETATDEAWIVHRLKRRCAKPATRLPP
jgi:hypothetical protein